MTSWHIAEGEEVGVGLKDGGNSDGEKGLIVINAGVAILRRRGVESKSGFGCEMQQALSKWGPGVRMWAMYALSDQPGTALGWTDATGSARASVQLFRHPNL